MTTPTSTYRLQLRPEFTFDDARDVVGYLTDLGVGAVYVSPVLDATPGSTHGYDVTDPRIARPALGGEEGRLALADALRAAGLGFVVDIVPNHMSIEVPSANPFWWDVLSKGRASQFAHWFDIDWSRDRVLVPVLGSADDLDALTVEGDQLAYYDQRFPITGDASGTPQEVHDRQSYELVDWRRGSTELNYRRFFDITTLAAVRVELQDVFEAVHAEVLRWVADGDVSGLRVDHPDGLADPTGYMQRLRDAAPQAWIVVEKILHPGEQLPISWPVDGTTGYDALGEIFGVLVDPAGEGALTSLAADLGQDTDYAAVEQTARRLVTDDILVAEVHRIAALVKDVDTAAARAAVAETMIAFDVYRSYLPDEAGHWHSSIATARERRPDLSAALDSLDRQVTDDPQGELATRIQQTSGMVVAKGTEDTTFYRYTRFAALNEVGGSPDRFGIGVDELHRLAAAREAGSPGAMTTLTTHDTKRSEDVRARLAVLAEVADEFAVHVRDWSPRAGLGEPSLELLAWQTLVGAAPISDERLVDYLLKAARESKIRTTWTDADEELEQRIRDWPAAVRDAVGDEVDAFVDGITPHGWTNALSQKLLQLTAPGVPDVYQGTELWDFSLVDPDNRRPVDYQQRRRMLARIGDGEVPAVDESGAAKLLLVHRALTRRRDRPELFRGYRALHAEGPAAEHAVAYARGADDGLVVVATRLPVGLGRAGGWRDTTIELGPGEWTDLLTGDVLEGAPARLASLLDRYPVALLVRS
ncbi:malto-oligosyltrehalose synthase [Aeromicrobium fastidiosum]|uniref:Malto-oligosyltrehalose synthase n=1 Tax=Aeromicrobium fastidiosum TaxID=52699 RepID=A0A641AKT5_9ACTN|nr:malto-oligosyltrehalose synthase [Aeromicrobium fastidiosum]KAA1373767.1 malto-oligosyltrehalose synthase [Aeromicrobium fastidiosum]MBP2391339.1 (1->4)-alpha-D-glucan 1-alpha-D-glucosylmutase [Aeromicrobium fastidiosum]